MRDKDLSKVVENVVPSVIDRVAPDMLGSIAEITKCISSIPIGYLKSKTMIMQAIAELGVEWVEYSAPIAEKIVECVKVAELADCQKSEMIITAVLDADDVPITEKIDMVIKWENNEHQHKLEKAKVIMLGVCATILVAGASVSMVRSSKIWAKKIPKMIEKISNNDVKKEKEKTKRKSTKEKEETKRQKNKK